MPRQRQYIALDTKPDQTTTATGNWAKELKGYSDYALMEKFIVRSCFFSQRL